MKNFPQNAGKSNSNGIEPVRTICSVLKVYAFRDASLIRTLLSVLFLSFFILERSIAPNSLEGFLFCLSFEKIMTHFGSPPPTFFILIISTLLPSSFLLPPNFKLCSSSNRSNIYYSPTLNWNTWSSLNSLEERNKEGLKCVWIPAWYIKNRCLWGGRNFPLPS